MLETQLSAAETQLGAILNAAPIRDVYFGDIDVPRQYPAVYIQITSATEANQYSVDDLKGWIVSYDVTVMSGGSFATARANVHTVYNWLQAQQATDALLSGTVADINVDEIQYGLIDIGDQPMLTGGIIKLQLLILETNIHS
jgi:hypothetical protein